MAYTKARADWIDYPDTSTPITAANLETIEQGIADAHAAIDAITAQPINAQTGTTYTLVASDAGKLVTLTNAAASTAFSTAKKGGRRGFPRRPPSSIHGAFNSIVRRRIGRTLKPPPSRELSSSRP